MMYVGLDEAGYGSGVGPIYTSAVVFDDYTHIFISELVDSKMLDHEQRVELVKEIQSQAIAYTVDHATLEDIYELNLGILRQQKEKHL